MNLFQFFLSWGSDKEGAFPSVAYVEAKTWGEAIDSLAEHFRKEGVGEIVISSGQLLAVLPNQWMNMKKTGLENFGVYLKKE